MATAIEFNNISKQYRLGLVSTRTLGADLNRWWTMNVRHKEDPFLKIGSVNDRSSAADSEFVWALRDIDFKVEQGDVVGIIGKNGAGKSTLLKLLSKVTAPTTGTIRARGRIGSLLEVGTGFHPEMTGRENIYLNGAIMGMTKQEITAKLDEIVDFSGCERYLDTPVKRYSSGMTVRLGFAVAAHLEPEILVVDEVLAVGDAEFQKKAIAKMQDVSRGEGRTVLFVSHNMASISTLCKSCVLLDKGTIGFMGNTDECIGYYYSSCERGDADSFSILRDVQYKAKDIEILDLKVGGKAPELYILTKDSDNALDIEVELSATTHHDIYLVASLFEGSDMVASFSSQSGAGHIYRLDSGKHIIREKVYLPKNLVNGSYYLSLKLNDSNGGNLVDMPRIMKVHKEGYCSLYTGTSFTKSNSGYFAITDED